jgi:hypothetical protein
MSRPKKNQEKQEVVQQEQLEVVQPEEVQVESFEVEINEEPKALPQEIKIVEYTFVDFVVAISEAARVGYEIDLTKNEGYPHNYVTMYELTMYKTA